MKSKFKNYNLTFRKLKISDYDKFQELFYLTFKKRMSLNFFKWRYFNDRFSFCYGVFLSSKLIANVGLKSLKLNNKKNEIVLSRHSSMVLKHYQGIGIYSYMLKKIKKNLPNKVSAVVMWPNKNNFANFGILGKNIIKKKIFLYQTAQKFKEYKKTNYYKIDQINNFKNLITNNNNFFLKDLNYFKQRYCQFNESDYLINKFELKNQKSFFILKIIKNFSNSNFIVLEHFGSKKLKKRHFFQLINESKKITFCSKYKTNYTKYKLLNHLNINIGFLKNIDIKKKKKELSKNEFMLGDTDSFISLK